MSSDERPPRGRHRGRGGDGPGIVCDPAIRQGGRGPERRRGAGGVMGSLLAHGGMFVASNTLLVFLPFILAGPGFGFIMGAFPEKTARNPAAGPPRLPT